MRMEERMRKISGRRVFAFEKVMNINLFKHAHFFLQVIRVVNSKEDMIMI